MGHFLKEYCAANPGLEIRDVFKYLYQSCFGCEHLLSDKEYVLSRIKDEIEDASADMLPEIEMLEGDFGRIHLKRLSKGLKPETLCMLFMLSAEKQYEGEEKLKNSLTEFLNLAQIGELPFTYDEVSEKVGEWEKLGFPAVRHSERFREKYHPAYRVIKKELIKLLPVLELIDSLPRKEYLIISIDGRCASGKTTLAAMLGKIYDCNVFHMDDYFLRPEQRTAERLNTPGENIDHERFLGEVIEPLSEDKPVLTARYDCSTKKLREPVMYPSEVLNFVEGVYCMHPELSDYYDLKLILDIEPEKQKRRILRRNSAEMAQRFFNEWIPMEESYFKTFSVYENADLIFKME